MHRSRDCDGIEEGGVVRGGDRPIRLLLVGDVMLGRSVNASLRMLPPEHPWGDTLPILRRADLRLCNLECVISDCGRPWTQTSKAFHFRSDARNIEVLRCARIDGVSLANNHVLDFEADALLEMLDGLDASGVAHAGAGHDLAEAARPAPLRTSGPRVGLLAFTDNEPGWAAGERRPGTSFVPAGADGAGARRLLAQVADAAAAYDVLVVSAHWGPNWGEEPPRAHVALGHALVDAGALVVFGHSPHVFRGIEPYHGGLILYSTGDFIDDYAVDEVERNDWSAIFDVDLDDRAVRGVRMTPTVIRGNAAHRARGAERDAIARKLSRLCAGRGTRTKWDAAEGALVWRAGE